MGFYAEPKSNKRKWLHKVGKKTEKLFPSMQDDDRPANTWPVTLLDFMAYAALGVSHNDKELSRFIDSAQYVYTYWVPVEELDKVMWPSYSETLNTLENEDRVEVQRAPTDETL